MGTVTAREFNQDVGAAKRIAAQSPVIITDRGTPTYVLMSIADYRRLTGQQRSLVEQLRMEDDTVAFDPPRMSPGFQVPDL